MNLRRYLVMLTMVLVIILTIVIWFFPPDDDFRIENPFWNGTKDIGSGYPFLPIDSLSKLHTSPQGSTLIIIPYLQFSSAELEAIDSFVASGGTLILADDYGYGNQVLEYLGLKIQF